LKDVWETCASSCTVVMYFSFELREVLLLEQKFCHMKRCIRCTGAGQKTQISCLCQILLRSEFKYISLYYVPVALICEDHSSYEGQYMLLLDDLSSLLQKIKQYLLFAKASFLCQLSTLLLFSFTLRYKHSFVPA